jgi:hypothetical protein
MLQDPSCRDPGERRSLLDQKKTQAARMREDLLAWHRRVRALY